MLNRISLRPSLFADQRFINILNMALILLTCGLAHLYPYQLLLASYAILGPAHYLTQISWMHDRHYFVRARGIAPIFAVMTIFLLLNSSMAGAAIIFMATLGCALAFVLSEQPFIIIAGTGAGAALGSLMVGYIGPLALFIVILLPTVLHIFVFTGCFMWVGAIKARSATGYATLVVFAAAAASFLLPGNAEAPPSLAGIVFFQPIVDYMQKLLPGAVGTKLFGFLGFAYSYHYLNWFSKAEVIKWNHIPRRRLWMIIAIYVMIEGIYASNYIIGFMLILFASLLHVLLEFPLNIRTFGTLGGAIMESMGLKK